MVDIDIKDINDVKGTSVTEPQVKNTPKIDDELRKQIITEEKIKIKSAEEAQSKIQSKIEMGAPQHTNQNQTITPQVTNDGLTVDDMSRINQDMNNLKREMRQEVIDSNNENKKLEADIRAKVLRELQEEQAKKTIAEQVANSNDTIVKLQEQIKVLNERIPKSNIGQEVDNKSPFDNEKSLENASESDLKRIDEASRIAFQRERMHL